MYYLAPTIGTGTDPDPYRPKISNYNCSWAAVYENPGEKTSIVAVSTTPEVIALIEADTEITFLGDTLEEAVTTEEFQRICPNGTVMVYG